MGIKPQQCYRGAWVVRGARWSVLVAWCVLLGAGNVSAGASSRLHVERGEAFPEMELVSLLTEDGYRNLGLEATAGPFRLNDVPGELLVVEFFSRYCLTCQRQAPYLQSFFEVVSGGELAGKVRLLAVGVGSRARELMAFRQQLALTYPIAPDPLFENLMQVGEPGGTPFTLYLLRRAGAWVVADYHLGFQGDVELMARVRILLDQKETVVAGTGQPVRPTSTAPELGLSPTQREQRAREFLGVLAGEQVRVVNVGLGEATDVYRAIDADGLPMDLYARIASRQPVCDLCHAVHFLLGFDTAGRVRGVAPIYVTKYGNELWDERDVKHLEARLHGRLMAEVRFDPAVDAVSRATMSSALIFDEVRRTAELLPRLRAP